MSFRDCIERNVRDSEFKKVLLKNASDEEMASKVVEHIRQQRAGILSTLLDSKKKAQLTERLRTAERRGLTSTAKKFDPQEEVVSMVEGEGARGELSMSARADALKHSAHKNLDGELRKARVKNIAGKWWNRIDDKWNKEASIAIHGGRVEDEGMMAFGEAFRNVTKKFAKLLNDTGMNINIKEDFYLPHKHAPDRVRAVGETEWISDVKKYFDMENLIYEGSTETVDELLKRMYRNIVSYASAPEGSLREMQRRLKVKDGDAWFMYNQKYGDTDIFGSIMRYIDTTSNEIAARQTFGSKPRQMVESLVRESKSIGEELTAGGAKVRRGKIQGDLALHTFDNLMGFKEHGSATFAKIGQAARVIQVVTDLGLATVTALTDVGFSYAAATLKSMPIMGMLRTQLSEILFQGNRKFLSQLGVISDVIINDVQQAHRMADVAGNGVAIKIAHAYTRLIGLNRWTQGMKTGHMYQLLAHLTNVSREGATPGMKAALARYGIDEGALSHLAKAERIVNKGAEFIDPRKLEPELQAKVLAMLHAETRAAVPEATARARAGLNWGHAPGTFQGEIIRTTTQFKSFPMTMLQAQSATYRSLPTRGMRGKYLANLLGGTTVMGAASLWIKDLLNGKEPRPIDPEFAWKALVQGGAGGPFVDMLAHTGEYGGTVQDFLGGPTAGLVNFMITAPKDLMKGKDNVGGRAASTALKQLGQVAGPLKLLANRYWLDGLRELADPREYERRMREQNRMWEKGQDFYWPVGQRTPDF